MNDQYNSDDKKNKMDQDYDPISLMSEKEQRAYAKKAGIFVTGGIIAVVLLAVTGLSQTSLELPTTERLGEKSPFVAPQKYQQPRLEEERQIYKQDIETAEQDPILSPPPDYPQGHPGFNRYRQAGKAFVSATGYVSAIVPRRDWMPEGIFVENSYARVEYAYPDGGQCYFHEFLGAGAERAQYAVGDEVRVGYQPDAPDYCGSSYISIP